MTTATTRGYICKTGARVDQDSDERGRRCNGHPACFHLRRPDGSYENAQPAWKEAPDSSADDRGNGTAKTGGKATEAASARPRPGRTS